MARNVFYKAPDGSLFKVNEDGRVEKIREGQKNPYIINREYNVSADGRIYIFEEDGSIRILGRAERVAYQDGKVVPLSHNSGSQKRKNGIKKGNDNFIWIVSAIAVIAMVGILSFVAFRDSGSPKQRVAVAQGSQRPEIVKKENNEVSADTDKQERNDGRKYFATTISYYGRKTEFADEETVNIEFYSDGECYIEYSNIEESCEGPGKYYIKGNKLVLKISCFEYKAETFTLHSDGSFTYYGIVMRPR